MLVSSRRYTQDEIELAYDAAYCKKELQIECKGCKKYFYPVGSQQFKYMTQDEYKKKYDIQKIDNFTSYKKEARDTGRLVCECGHKHTFRDIEDLIRDKKVRLIIVDGEDEDIRHGYKLNALATGLTKYSTLVEELIDAGNDEAKLDRIYRGYFNELYEIVDKKVDSSDLGLLEAEEEEFVVPEDTASIYIGIDTQKGYYWLTIVAMRYGMSPHLMWAGRVEDEETIESFMDREYFYKNGRQYTGGVKRVGQDWQGYREYKEEINDETGEVTRDTVMDMPQRVKEFAFKMAEKYGADKDGRERFYATRGEEFLTNDEPFKFATTEVTVSNYKDTRKIKTLKLGTTVLKSAFMSTLMRSIQKAKATENDEAYTFEQRLFTINKTQCDKLNNREKNIKS
jgi:hypothetical protein